MKRTVQTRHVSPGSGPAGSSVSARPFAEPIGRAGDALEREADRAADAVARGRLLRGETGKWSAASASEGLTSESAKGEAQTIRRAPKDPAAATEEPAALAVSAAPAKMAGEPATADRDRPRGEAAPVLLVDDDAEPTAGQMRKREFLSALRSQACAAVDGALSGTGRDSQGCPWIDHWFGYYESRSASQIERSLHRYAPEARGAATARAYIRLVVARIRRSAETYATTGEVTDVPDDVPVGSMAGGALLGMFGGMFFKARPGGARPGDPVSVREQLGSGQRLPGDVQTRMESAFGTSFDGVRLHADAVGARVSDRLNARAFTVGRHVAFGPGEFRPGTIAGDALIAHELAHVVQQGGTASSRTIAKSPDSAGRLEGDADRSAAGAIALLWDRTSRSMGMVRGNAMPALRSRLTLSRCGKSPREKEVERLGNVQYGFLEDRRKAEEERLKKEAEEDAKKKGLPPPATTPRVELSDITKKDQAEHGLKGSPTTEWDSVVDKPAWRKKATDTWARVVASVKGTELEVVVKGVTFKFDPEAALKGGFYASFNSGSETLTVGMSWVRFAEKDPKNAWENLAHEVGGHRRYGKTYSTEIMDSALAKLSSAKRAAVIGDPQKFFEAYSYPETEIYASLWQRRYRVPESGAAPESGGLHPDINIDNKLEVMKKALHPEVALAVLRELKRRVDANDQILERDKKYFVSRVKAILGHDL
jgi:hypothetical protein